MDHLFCRRPKAAAAIRTLRSGPAFGRPVKIGASCQLFCPLFRHGMSFQFGAEWCVERRACGRRAATWSSCAIAHAAPEHALRTGELPPQRFVGTVC